MIIERSVRVLADSDPDVMVFLLHIRKNHLLMVPWPPTVAAEQNKYHKKPALVKLLGCVLLGLFTT